MVAALVVAGLVVGPLRLTWPLRSATWQAGGSEGLARLCGEVGPGDVALLAADGSVALQLLPSMHAFCAVEAEGLEPTLGVPAAVPVAAEVASLVGAAGRDLQVVGPTREVVETLAPDAVDLRPVTVLQTSQVGTTIGRPPGAVGDLSFTVWVGTVPPPVA